MVATAFDRMSKVSAKVVIFMSLVAPSFAFHPFLRTGLRWSQNDEKLSRRNAISTFNVTTTSGLVEGTSYEESHAFYNIPYGNVTGRFMPATTASYINYINATTPEYIVCHQPIEFRPDSVPKEQCLLLNVNVPSQVNLESLLNLLPVMVYIHGGSFAGGSCNDPELEGRFFANATNTIFVTINYRLGPLGFFVYEESGTKFEGNQGLKDQQLALQWVQDNIDKFGGDKSQVTIFGESAGAQSVVQHLISPTSKPLFNRAIIMSTPGSIRLQTIDEAKANAQQLIERLNCNNEQSNLTCLLNADLIDLVTEGWNLAFTALLKGDLLTYFEPFRPSIDEGEYTEDYMDMFQAGRWHTEKKVIIGNMMREMGHISVNYPGYRDEVAFQEINSQLFGEELGNLTSDKYIELSANTPGSQVNYTEVAEDEFSDALFYCPSRTLARFMSDTSSVQNPSPVYFYVNAHAPSGPTCENIQDPKLCGIPNHASELTFVFRTGPSMGYETTKDDVAVYDWFSLWWGSFAYTGSPSTSAGSDQWPEYVNNQQNSVGAWSSVRISAAPSLDTDHRGKYCDYWDSTGLYVTMTPPAEATTSPTDVTTSSGNRIVVSSWVLLAFTAAMSRV